MRHLFVIIKIWKVSSQISYFIIEQTIPTSMVRRNMLLLHYAMQNRFILMPMKRRILYHNIYLKIQFHKVNVICDKVIQIFIYTDIIIRLYRQIRIFQVLQESVISNIAEIIFLVSLCRFGNVQHFKYFNITIYWQFIV